MDRQTIDITCVIYYLVLLLCDKIGLFLGSFIIVVEGGGRIQVKQPLYIESSSASITKYNLDTTFLAIKIGSNLFRFEMEFFGLWD